ncbi:hypothetical protein CspHIS471_0509850 [Cutaneotrichosporon sp. HIS471]|nr:hypothetical protein CspHIS471_0509850 [Cutaneotrichosporon sp. HIS471]
MTVQQNGSPTAGPLRILVANRNEIAVRIQSSIHHLGHIPLGIYTASEGVYAPHLLHLPLESRVQIPGDGVAAYLDIAGVIGAAKEGGADAVIPGYGFLSESPAFASAVQEAGLLWIGPRSETLALFGDKYASKRFAQQCGVPVLSSTSSNASLDEIREFAKKLPPGTKAILKALEGGGGRGIRIVHDMADIQEAYEGCKREAMSSFGSDKVFAEPFLHGARHIEVQVVGDGQGNAVDVGERECTLQRRHQKLIELCPSPTLARLPKLRAAIIKSAVDIAKAGKLLSLSTIEFLFVAPANGHEGHYYFLECNPRLQVEHTVTEEAYGVDLVATQIRLALGEPLKDVLPPTPAVAPRAALQLRINAEKLQPDGTAVGTTGALTAFLTPSGKGIRVDTAAHPPLGGAVGTYRQGLAFDSLLAKIIIVGPDYTTNIARARRALEQLRVAGVQTNRALLLALTEDERVITNRDISTRFVEQNSDALYTRVQALEKQWAEEAAAAPGGAVEVEMKSSLPPAGPGETYVKVHLPGRLVNLALKDGATIRKGDTVAILESMKMEHTVRSEVSGIVVKTLAKEGDNLDDGAAVALLAVSDGVDDGAGANDTASKIDLDSKTDSLLELESIRADMEDDSKVRAKATQRRRDRGYRTARENMAHLVDYGTFLEYGDFALAAQRTRLSPEALVATRNDGVIVGWGKVNGRRTAICMYDYGVLAGTQGYFHHQKLDRLFSSVLASPAPLVLYAEGGGGRPGDVDLIYQKVAGLHGPSFTLLAHINARGIPIIGVGNGYLFAGNAALLGTSDFIIATSNKGTSIGMGGPAMIEGGGLGVFAPEDVGPISSHLENGNVDIVVKDEEEATNVAKALLGFFQARPPAPPRSDDFYWTRDPRLFRHAIPTDRKRAYDMHGILDLLSDDDTPFLEIGPHWGQSLITGFIRVQGQTVGVVASNVLSPLGGAIDAPSARKATRFMNILSKTRAGHLLALCDTPGFMVGPCAEPEGGLRAFADYFAAGARFIDEGGQIFGVTIRKAYGLGAQALLGGSTHVPFHSVAWPSGEFAGMGIEGAVRLGMKKELEAIADLEQRAKQEQVFIDDMYVRGRAINMAQSTEIDSVIDPAETRDWVIRCLEAVERRSGFDPNTGKRSKL